MSLAEKILSWKLKWNKNYSAKKRKSTPFSLSKNIGIVVKNDNQRYNSGIEELIKSLTAEGKHIEVVCYHSKIINSKYNFPLFNFSKQEVKWNGNIENSHVKRLLESDFDYLISIADEMDEVLNYLLCKSSAKLRISNAGVHNESNSDLMISSSNDKDLSVAAKQIDHYIRKISLKLEDVQNMKLHSFLICFQITMRSDKLLI